MVSSIGSWIFLLRKKGNDIVLRSVSMWALSVLSRVPVGWLDFTRVVIDCHRWNGQLGRQLDLSAKEERELLETICRCWNGVESRRPYETFVFLEWVRAEFESVVGQHISAGGWYLYDNVLFVTWVLLWTSGRNVGQLSSYVLFEYVRGAIMTVIISWAVWMLMRKYECALTCCKKHQDVETSQWWNWYEDISLLFYSASITYI